MWRKFKSHTQHLVRRGFILSSPHAAIPLRYLPDAILPRGGEHCVVTFLRRQPAYACAKANRMTGLDAQLMLKWRCRALHIAPVVNPHSIRHLFAIKVLNDGVRIEVVSRILGHANVDFTLEVYASLLMGTIQ